MSPKQPHRVEIGKDGAAYEISIEPDYTPPLIAVQIWDVTGDDAHVCLQPQEATKLRDDISRVLAVIATGGQVRTPGGTALLGAVRRNFELLAELEKTSPAEVANILAFIVAHIRSWNAQAVIAGELIASAEEVRRG